VSEESQIDATALCRGAFTYAAKRSFSLSVGIEALRGIDAVPVAANVNAQRHKAVASPKN